MKKRLLYFQACVAIEAPDDMSEEDIDDSVSITVSLSHLHNPKVTSVGDVEISFIESMEAEW